MESLTITTDNELAIQHSMDIDSSSSPAGSPTHTRQQQQQQPHTCRNTNQLSVSPTSSSSSSCSTMELLESPSTAVAVPKKCTCPYERPTLKTKEAAANAAVDSTTVRNQQASSYQSAVVSPVSSSTSVTAASSPSLSLSAAQQQQQEDDSRNANHVAPQLALVPTAEDFAMADDQLNNNSRDTINLSDVCDNEGATKDMNSNHPATSIMSSSSGEHQQVVKPQVNSEQKKKSKKKQPSSDKCNCSEVTLRVKAAESPPPPPTTTSRLSLGRSSLQDGSILSNCLSALNFVSGNRIMGNSDSKSGGGSSSNRNSTSSTGGSSGGRRSPRSSKSSSDSQMSGNSIGGQQQQRCGEACSKKGSSSSSSSATEMTQPPTKLCKTCRGHEAAKGGSTAGAESQAVAPPSKAKRNPWALRFNCVRLKGSKSSSSSSTMIPSPAVKESSVCKCSLESTTKVAAVPATKNASSGIGGTDGGSSSRKKSTKNNASEEPSTTTTAAAATTRRTPTTTTATTEEVISNVNTVASCSRVTTVPVGATSAAAQSSSSSTDSLSASMNSGIIGGLAGDSINSASSSTKAVLNPIEGGAAALQDSSRFSFMSVLSTEDCDEWARMQREKEIEDGVEAPPGYLPKFQINKMQNAQVATNQQGSTDTTTGSKEASSHAAAAQGSVVVAALSQHQQQQQPQLMGAPLPSLGGLASSQWPHIICASSPEWQQQQRFLMQQALLASAAANSGPKVHSQVDFIHCLVPDLQKITSCGFYWGKMDRYQAETLLDGKPEGTFLLRDSAQEEFLFSVSFRKYGRSLHARIEQFNHKFSFDSHDPGVYTANTVTGLLEHYKDPSCVMFFEPMLTQPLNRNFCFSLQQLCRATIVSETTYDSIGQLKLPAVMKGYLKEYHYKQKVRVQLFDELRCRHAEYD